MSDYKTSPASERPTVRPVTYADVRRSLRRGWEDFTKVPLYGMFFGGVYAFGGVLIYLLLSTYQKPWMIIPIAIGFPLLGPFLAAGTYEVSRRIGAREPLEFTSILGFITRQSRREFSWMAFVILFIFWIWMYQARILIALFMEMQAFSSLGTMVSALFTTADGLTMIAIGTLLGGMLAAVLFMSTVISLPLLVERDLDIVTAIAISWSAVFKSPGPMLFWGTIVAATTFVSMIPLFIGLFITFPVLGFATWHLYRAAIENP